MAERALSFIPLFLLNVKLRDRGKPNVLRFIQNDYSTTIETAIAVVASVRTVNKSEFH